MIREVRRDALSGIPILMLLVVTTLALVGWLIWAATRQSAWEAITAAVLLLPTAIVYAGLFTVAPNQGRVLQLFGEYKGTAREPGLRFTNPFYTKMRISLRVRNFETAKLKVNDKRSNPIEIAAVVVWRVVDTAEAAFQVDNYENYVHVQSEAALRNLATGYPYDVHGADDIALSSHTGEVSTQLRKEIQDRLAQAGVEVIETRVSHLAYAPEIASAMLRRQQAAAVVAARQTIVEGAVGMVDHALEMLAAKRVITLDEERKAAMVSNLLVVLCSEHSTQPVVNTGSLYH